MVLIWEFLVRAIQWIPTQQGLDGFQKSLHPCALDASSLGIGRVNPVWKAGRQKIVFVHLVKKWPVKRGHLSFSPSYAEAIMSKAQFYVDRKKKASILGEVFKKMSKAQGRKDYWKASKPCHVGIHWKGLAEYSQMSTHLSGFQSFLYHFKLAKLATSSIRVNG